VGVGFNAGLAIALRASLPRAEDALR
jgi:hypothetical protein